MTSVFSSLQKSYSLTKASLTVLRADKELFFYALAAGFFHFLLLFAVVFSFYFVFLSPTRLVSEPNIVLIFLFFLPFFFLFSLITNLFIFGVVYTSKERFKGNNATVFSTLRYVLSRFYSIVVWSFFTAFVRWFIELLATLLRKKLSSARFGSDSLKTPLSLLSFLLSEAWGVLAMLVPAIMVIDNTEPIPAIKHSYFTLKKNWGQRLIKRYGFSPLIGLFAFASLLLLVLLVLGFTLFLSDSHPLTYDFLVKSSMIAVLLFNLWLIVFFSILSHIYNTALYWYTKTGEVPLRFNEQLLKEPFEKAQ
ncbi:MAG: DUF6159 family protein [Candidatus Woesearchaeota archaeon]